MALLSLVWGGTAISVHVFHLYWTACQCKGCSTKKMNCMHSSNSSHLILACLAATQHFVSTESDIGADHFQKPWWFLHVDYSQQAIIRIKPAPFSMLSPAGRAPPSTNLPTCLSAPSQSTFSVLLLALVGSAGSTTGPRVISWVYTCSTGVLNEQAIVLCWALFRDRVHVPNPDWIS